MLKENWKFIATLERWGDVLIIIASFFLAYYGRASFIFWEKKLGLTLPLSGQGLASIEAYMPVLFLGLIFYILGLNAVGAYASMRLTTAWWILRRSLIVSLSVFLAISAGLFLMKLDLSRVVVVLFCLLAALSLTAQRYMILFVLRLLRRRGHNFRNIIICGTGAQARTLARRIWRRPELGIRVRGFGALDDSSDTIEFKSALKKIAPSNSIIVIQGKEGVKRALTDWAIDEVIFTDFIEVMPAVQEVVLSCSEQGIRTTLAADFFNSGILKSGLSYFGDMPLIHFQTPPGDRWGLNLKRLLDIAVSALLLIMLAPLFALIALLVKISSPGPVIFSQKRMGLHGRLFNLYKFRSMYSDAEELLDSLKDANEMNGPVFKLKKDPRVTSFGRFLRRFSLDELPQLINVLRGEMSLVGPRPPLPGEVSLYERSDRRRLSMRPGLTCTWQVSGRNEIKDFGKWVEMDLDYIDNWSLSRDLILLVRTIPAVLFGVGAR